MRNLYGLVFVAGIVTLGMELSAARLLEPVFGNNQIVWAALIGMILLYLAIGAWLGGKLADRYPHRRGLDIVLTVAAVGVALAPAFSRPVLRLAAGGMDGFVVGLLAAALLAVVLLFAVPGVLLGVAGPWAIRLALQNREDAGQPPHQKSGQTVGRLYAVSTLGSLLGTFLPVLWLIPTFGTRWTFYLLALSLLAALTLGSLRTSHRWVAWIGIATVLGLALFSQPGGPIRGDWDDGAGAILYEEESIYNYVVVRQWGTEHHLKLNDGIGIHSVYHPDAVLSQGIWDYFLLAPLLRTPPAVSEAALPDGEHEILLIGLAAGTVSNLYTDIYGPMPITGVELDPTIIEVGTTYFDMARPNLTAIAADGRGWLRRQPPATTFDLIAVDAYRPPYIPFHLTTLEFFQLTRQHLHETGVLAINIGRTDTNFTLVDALAATVAQVYPSVYLIDEPGPPGVLANTLLVATAQPTTLENLYANVAALPAHLPPEFRAFAQTAQTYARDFSPHADAAIFTDDHAPVELVVHGIIWDYLQGN
ncbi:MAG: fused MFS/spermidine synthase [Litorilinea sp.]